MFVSSCYNYLEATNWNETVRSPRVKPSRADAGLVIWTVSGPSLKSNKGNKAITDKATCSRLLVMLRPISISISLALTLRWAAPSTQLGLISISQRSSRSVKHFGDGSVTMSNGCTDPSHKHRKRTMTVTDVLIKGLWDFIYQWMRRTQRPRCVWSRAVLRSTLFMRFIRKHEIAAADGGSLGNRAGGAFASPAIITEASCSQPRSGTI